MPMTNISIIVKHSIYLCLKVRIFFKKKSNDNLFNFIEYFTLYVSVNLLHKYLIIIYFLFKCTQILL